MQRSQFTQQLFILPIEIEIEKNRKHFSRICCGYSAQKTLSDASGIVGLLLLKGHFDTRGHRQMSAKFIPFSVSFLIKAKPKEYCYGLGT